MVTLSLIRLITNTIFTIIEFFVGLRIILRFAAANPAAPFVGWIYSTSDTILAPFAQMFPVSRVQGGSVIDFSALVGLLIYLFIHYAILEAIRYLGRIAAEREHEAEHEIGRRDRNMGHRRTVMH